jgi:hypothetical protein
MKNEKARHPAGRFSIFHLKFEILNFDVSLETLRLALQRER